MIEFEVKSVEVKIGKHAGKTMYYAAPKVNKRYTQRDLENYIISATALSRGDVRNALTSLAEFVNMGLAQGAGVELADLGMLKVSVSAQQMEDPKKVTAATLKQPQVRFFPKKEMADAARSVKTKVINAYTKTVTEGEGTADNEQ